MFHLFKSTFISFSILKFPLYIIYAFLMKFIPRFFFCSHYKLFLLPVHLLIGYLYIGKLLVFIKFSLGNLIKLIDSKKFSSCLSFSSHLQIMVILPLFSNFFLVAFSLNFHSIRTMISDSGNSIILALL